MCKAATFTSEHAERGRVKLHTGPAWVPACGVLCLCICADAACLHLRVCATLPPARRAHEENTIISSRAFPTGGVKGSEVRGDGGGGVACNMWVCVTAAAVITAL